MKAPVFLDSDAKPLWAATPGEKSCQGIWLQYMVNSNITGGFFWKHRSYNGKGASSHVTLEDVCERVEAGNVCVLKSVWAELHGFN